MGFVFAAHAGQAVPKIDAHAPVVGVAHHGAQATALNQLTILAAKLKFVAVVIN
jgi:hypothetical protein